MSARRKDPSDRPAGGPAAPASGTPASAAPASDGGRLTLPSSGLAADILRQFGLPAQAVAPPPAAAAAVEDRIYAFADEMGAAAAAAEDEERAEQLETWVTFRLLDESYALPVSHVQEILRVGDITRVPHAPGPVRGITNLRGRVLTVVDLRLRLGLPRTEVETSSRILVVSARGRLIGLLVDAVSQVVRLARERVEAAPADVLTIHSDYILGVHQSDAGLLILLDVERVLLLREEAH